jgi:predicted PurR-regulated permease PerM
MRDRIATPSETGTSDLTPRTLRKAAGYAWQLLLVAAAAGVAIFALTRLGLVVLPVLVALFVTAVLDSPAGWLRRRGLPSWAATVLTLIGALALSGGVGALILPSVIEQFGSLDFNVQQGLERVERYLASVLPVTQAALRSALGDALNTLQAQLRELTGGFFGIAQIVLELLIGAVIALFAVFFFLKDGRGFFAGFCGLFPERRQGDVREIGHRCWQVLQRYIQGLTFVALVDSALIAVALLLIGVPLVLPLAVIAFFAAFVPYVGAVTAGLLAALVALVSGGLVDALLIVAAIVLIQQIEGNLLYPLIVGRRVRLHPLATLLAVTAGGVLAGLLGAVLAVPLTAVVITVVNYLRSHDREPEGDGASARTRPSRQVRSDEPALMSQRSERPTVPSD